jgi:IclR family KDG regulon transcriptional repressor
MAKNESNTAESGPNYQVRALERALDILQVFSLDAPEWTLSELVDRVGLAKSTVIRLIAVLEANGMVERSEWTDRYRLGIRVFEMGSIYIQTTSMESEAMPFLRHLARTCEQTANLAILDRGQIIHIAVVEPDRPLRFSWPKGQREPIHCSGLGKALVLDYTRDELANALAVSGLPARTKHTITDIDALWNHLRERRARGWVIDDEEAFLGLRCVAAPIRDARNAIVAAISISGSRTDLSAEELPALGAMVLAAARGISARIGQGIHLANDIDEEAMTTVLERLN